MILRIILGMALSLGLAVAQSAGTTQKSTKSSAGKSGKSAKGGQSNDGGATAYPTPGTVNGTADATVDAKGGLIDINSAGMDELKTLGIADEWVQRIINHRPYATKYQLVQKNIIPAPAYAKIKDKVIARQKPAAR